MTKFHELKKLSIFILVAMTLFSCQRSEKEVPAEIIKPDVAIEQFGFNYYDFNILHDTIRNGNTFGSILQG